MALIQQYFANRPPPSPVSPPPPAPPAPAPEPEPTPVPPPVVEEEPAPELVTFETELHKLVNEVRKKQGVKELIYDVKLAEIAEAHSVDMSPAGRNFYRQYSANEEPYKYPNAHTNPDGLGPGDRARKAGYTGWTRFGENIARFSGSNVKNMTKQQVAKRFFDLWWNSKGHKDNMLNSNYNRQGLGVYVYGNGVWATQNLVQKK